MAAILHDLDLRGSADYLSLIQRILPGIFWDEFLPTEIIPLS